MREIPEPVKERRIAWDLEMLGKLHERKRTLEKELTNVNGQIKGIDADLTLLKVGISPTHSPLDLLPKGPMERLKARLNLLNRR